MQLSQMKIRESHQGLVSQCASLSSGTLASISNLRNYEEIEKLRDELVALAKESPECENWQQVWKKWQKKSYLDDEKFRGELVALVKENLDKFGVQVQLIGKNGNITTVAKYFKTKEALDKWVEKKEEEGVIS